MPRTRTLIIALALAVALPAGLAHLSGCEDSPDAPVYDNPFDPNGPLDGDALQITATRGFNVITVEWEHYSGRNISVYAVDHHTDLETEWTALADTVLEDDDMETVRYYHVLPDPNRTHYYLVQGLTEDGDYTISGYTTPASSTTPPAVFTDAPQGGAASRYLNLKIITGEGDSIRVADNPAFTGALTLAAAAPGDTAYATWDFGPRADGDTLDTYVQSYTSGSYASLVNSSRLLVNFEPDFEVVGGVLSGIAYKVPAVVNDLRVEDLGVEQMRFASTEENLPSATWVPGDSIYAGYTLDTVTDDQYVWGEFQGDFGFNYTGSIRVRADMLEDATFTLELPQNLVTTHTRVGVECDAAARRMRFSDDPDFTDLDPPWRPYAAADSVDFTGIAGPLKIYGQFSNDWTDSPVLDDSLVFALLPLDIYFVTPPDGGEVEGGTVYEITGRAIAADGELLRTLEIDQGNGSGWLAIVQSQDWTTDWNVPAVVEATEVLLRARATTAIDTATTAITVTVQPAAR